MSLSGIRNEFLLQFFNTFITSLFRDFPCCGYCKTLKIFLQVFRSKQLTVCYKRGPMFDPCGTLATSAKFVFVSANVGALIV